MVPIEMILPLLPEAMSPVGFQCDFITPAFVIFSLLTAGSTVLSGVLAGRNDVDEIEGPDPQDAIDAANEADRKIRGSRENFLSRESRKGPIQLQAPTLKI